jgi:light-regulated signal transduction histidine kinase (bacteriophytochrome)
MDANKRLHTEVDHRKTMQAKNEILLLKLETKNNELTEFTSIASHDLQEPLRKIISFGDRLRNLLKEDDEKSNLYLDRIQKASMRMSNLIQALLDLSHIHKDSRPFIQIDLNEVVQEVTEDLELQIKETRGTIEVTSLPVIRANRTQMQQLFQNLISNSLKFSKEGTPPEVRLMYNSTSNQHEIIIQDNGIGFDEKYALRIFKPFERLNGKSDFEGTGIGLSICEKIVQNHRGSIQARSQLNQGTTFVVVFPKDVS